MRQLCRPFAAIQSKIYIQRPLEDVPYGVVVTNPEHISNISAVAKYRRSWSYDGRPPVKKSTVTASASSRIVNSRLENASQTTNWRRCSGIGLSLMYLSYVPPKSLGIASICKSTARRLQHFINSEACKATHRNLKMMY